jgi:hypothetical protein
MTFLHLRPLQLSAQQRRVASQELTNALESLTLEEVIAERLSAFYKADMNERDPIRRRMLTNFSLAYSRAELEAAVRAHFQHLLRQ